VHIYNNVYHIKIKSATLNLKNSHLHIEFLFEVYLVSTLRSVSTQYVACLAEAFNSCCKS